MKKLTQERLKQLLHYSPDDGKRVVLGTFGTIEEAKAAREAAEVIARG